MTDHLDKLEQLQLLVYTEMSRVAAAGERHGAAQEAVRRTLEALSSGRGGGGGGGGGGGAAEAAESLSRLAAEEIKEELIRRLGAAAAGSRSPSPAAAAAGRAAATARLDGPLPAGFAQIRVSIDRLRFQRRVGAGASGTTYLARYQGADVCVKVAGGAANDIEAWKTEVGALAKLRHANIVRCLGGPPEPPRAGVFLSSTARFFLQACCSSHRRTGLCSSTSRAPTSRAHWRRRRRVASPSASGRASPTGCSTCTRAA